MARKKRKVGAGGKPPSKQPSNYDGWLKRGRTILTECQLSDRFNRSYVAIGVDAFDRAIELLPNHPAAWLGKGSHLVEAGAGREPQAREALMRAVTIDPGNALAWMMLGACESQRATWSRPGNTSTRRSPSTPRFVTLPRTTTTSPRTLGTVLRQRAVPRARERIGEPVPATDLNWPARQDHSPCPPSRAWPRYFPLSSGCGATPARDAIGLSPPQPNSSRSIAIALSVSFPRRGCSPGSAPWSVWPRRPGPLGSGPVKLATVRCQGRRVKGIAVGLDS
jgi:hypothetical protein